MLPGDLTRPGWDGAASAGSEDVPPLKIQVHEPHELRMLSSFRPNCLNVKLSSMCSDPAVSRRGNRLRNINVLCSPGALSGCLLHSTLLQRAQSTVKFLRNMVADRVAVGAPWTLYFGFSAGKSPSQRHFDLLLIYSFVSVVFQEILIFLMKCESCVMPCRELLLVPSGLFVKRIIGGDLEKTCSIL